MSFSNNSNFSLIRLIATSLTTTYLVLLGNISHINAKPLDICIMDASCWTLPNNLNCIEIMYDSNPATTSYFKVPIKGGCSKANLQAFIAQRNVGKICENGKVTAYAKSASCPP